MRIGLRFGLGPGRFYIPVAGTKWRRRRKTSGRYWTHPGCSIHHRAQDPTKRCRVGRR